MKHFEPYSSDTPTVSTDLLQIRHATEYRYRRPVAFGRHQGMFRPHESNDLRLAAMAIDTEPASRVLWVHDVFSNSKAIFEFDAPSAVLSIVSTLNVVRTTIHRPHFPIEDDARRFPFDYPEDQRIDLAPLIRPEYDHPDEDVKDWASAIAAAAGPDTWAILNGVNSEIHQRLAYRRREEPGVQRPRETLALGAGSCRDFAVLMLEAVRQLGFAARFVTGYLYDPVIDNAHGGFRGAGATHAWVQVFLPGAGWIEFDPTNGLVASGNLIRTGVARTPSQAAPLTGSFVGDPSDFIGMTVNVEVTALAPTLNG